HPRGEAGEVRVLLRLAAWADWWSRGSLLPVLRLAGEPVVERGGPVGLAFVLADRPVHELVRHRVYVQSEALRFLFVGGRRGPVLRDRPRRLLPPGGGTAGSLHAGWLRSNDLPLHPLPARGGSSSSSCSS